MNINGLFWPVEVKQPKEVKRKPEPVWLKDDYLPYYDEAIKYRPDLISDEWLIRNTGAELYFDIESYRNYFLAGFKNSTGEIIQFELSDYVDTFTNQRDKFLYILNNFLIFGFNSIAYDIPLSLFALYKPDPILIKQASDSLIVENLSWYNLLKNNKIKIDPRKFDHVDLINVAPGKYNLKTYGGRMNSRKLQDLPFPPDAVLNEKQITVLRYYWVNDLDITQDLRNELKEALNVRADMSKKYRVELRSKSDAQIAEAVFRSEYKRITGKYITTDDIRTGYTFKYKMPDFIRFQTPILQYVYETVKNATFRVGMHDAKVSLPEEISALKIQIGRSLYQMGIGGLHSTEECQAFVLKEDSNFEIIDRDVASYYPNIILNQNAYPDKLGMIFQDTYRSILAERLEAKKNAKLLKGQIKESRNESEIEILSGQLRQLSVEEAGKKISLNGSFGKLGEKFSCLFAPELLIQTTISGQLCLLMLIEAMEVCGIPVVSGNTDGIVMLIEKHKKGLSDQVVKWWESVTGFATEETKYKSIYMANVNNYLAITTSGDLKRKGQDMGKPGLWKHPKAAVCAEAVAKFLNDGSDIYDHIMNCRDITKFIILKNVNGGAVKMHKWQNKYDRLETVKRAGFIETEGGWVRHELDRVVSFDGAYLDAIGILREEDRPEYLGKVVRWYHAVGCPGPIVYAENGNMVPDSMDAKPIMELPEEFPEDVNYQWYVSEAEKMLQNFGYYKKEEL